MLLSPKLSFTDSAGGMNGLKAMKKVPPLALSGSACDSADSRRYSAPIEKPIGPPGSEKKPSVLPLRNAIASSSEALEKRCDVVVEKSIAAWLGAPSPNRLIGTQPG